MPILQMMPYKRKAPFMENTNNPTNFHFLKLKAICDLRN